MLVHLSSKDVIHSFGLYEMRVKQDAIPGLTIPVWFIPNRDRRSYEIACSQLCGLGHFRMRGFVTVQSAADYQKWFDDQEKELQPDGRDGHDRPTRSGPASAVVKLVPGRSPRSTARR